MHRRAQHTITAMGLCNTLGDSTDAVWRAICRGDRPLSRPPFDLPFATLCGAVANASSPKLYGHPSYDTRLTRIAVRALEPMLPYVHKLRARLGADRIGVVIGTSTGGLDATEPAYRHYRNNQSRAPGFTLRRAHAFDAVAQLVAAVCELSGPRYAISTACTSSAKAVASALRLIDGDHCDAVLVGGADSLCETTLRGFHALGVLSEAGSRPFSRQRTGIHIGEGAAFLMIEREGEGAVRVLSVGESSDAHSMSAPHPEGLGAARAMSSALLQAGLPMDAVEYVNAHGTGTDQNDTTESMAIRNTLGPAVLVSSTKGSTGHLLGAAGATEVVLACLAITHGLLPLSAGACPVDDTLGIQVLTQSYAKPIRVALSNSLAFGGSNAAVLLGAS